MSEAAAESAEQPTEQPRKCCGVPKGEEHANGCRYSPNDAEGNPKPLTPTQKKRVVAANREADIQADEGFENPVDEKDDLPDERAEWHRAPGFRRMQMDLSRDDRDHMDRIQNAIDRVVFDRFVDAYQIMNDVWEVVREAEDPEWVHPGTGEIGPMRDVHGFIIWKKSPISGKFYEDWSRLGLRQRENLLFEITTRQFDWEQRREALWTEAMFSKAIFTERFALAYDAPVSGTIDDRNAVANGKAAEDRYFALMQTSVSRRADSICRVMERIAQRLKDVMQS